MVTDRRRRRSGVDGRRKITDKDDAGRRLDEWTAKTDERRRRTVGEDKTAKMTFSCPSETSRQGKRKGRNVQAMGEKSWERNVLIRLGQMLPVSGEALGWTVMKPFHSFHRPSLSLFPIPFFFTLFPLAQLKCLGECCNFPSDSGQRPAANPFVVHFQLKELFR